MCVCAHAHSFDRLILTVRDTAGWRCAVYGMQSETPGLKAGKKSSRDYDKVHRLVYNCSRIVKV